MQKLEAKRDKSRYKDTSHWLDAVYRNNKNFIDDKLKNVMTTNKKRVFKNLVLEQSGAKLKDSLTIKELNNKLNTIKSPTKALKKLSRSDIFSSYKERAQENIYKFLKENSAIKKIKQLAGTKEKFNPAKLKWDYENNVYTYENVYIDISNSPKGVKIYQRLINYTE